MGSLDLDYRIKSRAEGDSLLAVSATDFASFNPGLLRLGSISHEGEYVEALAAIFDLQGFTDFCSQIDPHLAVPEFLDAFLSWLFGELGSKLKIAEDESEVLLWAPAPFFAKFMGDGVLFLWNMTHVKFPEDLGNVIIALNNLCASYTSEFVPKIRHSVVRPPQVLRCGIARGRVISIGGGADYVGSCINMAARLQKLGSLTFAFSRRGLPPDRCFDPSAADRFVARRIRIRGIGESELIMILREEFDAITDPAEKGELLEP